MFTYSTDSLKKIYIFHQSESSFSKCEDMGKSFFWDRFFQILVICDPSKVWDFMLGKVTPTKRIMSCGKPLANKANPFIDARRCKECWWHLPYLQQNGCFIMIFKANILMWFPNLSRFSLWVCSSFFFTLASLMKTSSSPCAMTKKEVPGRLVWSPGRRSGPEEKWKKTRLQITWKKTISENDVCLEMIFNFCLIFSFNAQSYGSVSTKKMTQKF